MKAAARFDRDLDAKVNGPKAETLTQPNLLTPRCPQCPCCVLILCTDGSWVCAGGCDQEHEEKIDARPCVRADVTNPATPFEG